MDQFDLLLFHLMHEEANDVGVCLECATIERSNDTNGGL